MAPRDHQIGPELPHELWQLRVPEDRGDVDAAGFEGFQQGARSGRHPEPPTIGEVQQDAGRCLVVPARLAHPLEVFVRRQHQVGRLGVVVAVLWRRLRIFVGLAAAEIVAGRVPEEVGHVARPAVLPIRADLLGVGGIPVARSEPVVPIGRDEKHTGTSLGSCGQAVLDGPRQRLHAATRDEDHVVAGEVGRLKVRIVHLFARPEPKADACRVGGVGQQEQLLRGHAEEQHPRHQQVVGNSACQEQRCRCACKPLQELSVAMRHHSPVAEGGPSGTYTTSPLSSR